MTRAIRVALDVTAVPSEPVGAGRYTIELARALAELDEVEMVLFSRRGDAARWTAIGDGTRPMAVVARAPDRRLGRLVYGELALGGAVRRHAPPAAVFHGPHYQMPSRLSTPAVVTVHDLTLVEHPEWHEPSKVIVFGRALRVAARHAAVVVCVSRHTAERFVDRYAPAGEVRVVVHGVDHGRFNPVADVAHDEALVAAVGVRAPYVLYLGTIEPRKNVPRLVDAFSKLGDSHPELQLVLAGQTAWGRDAVEAAIARSRHRGRIVQLGYVDDGLVAPLLRTAATVAYPSIEEGFGLPVLEALACGAPVVTSSGSVMAELAGPAALAVAAGDVDGLAAAIAESISGGTAVTERRHIGIERAAGFTWAASAHGHAEAYRAAAGQ